MEMASPMDEKIHSQVGGLWDYKRQKVLAVSKNESFGQNNKKTWTILIMIFGSE